MGQIQTNCITFCKELTEDNTEKVLLARRNKVQGLLNVLKSEQNNEKLNVGNYKLREINIKKLSTEHAI